MAIILALVVLAITACTCILLLFANMMSTTGQMKDGPTVAGIALTGLSIAVLLLYSHWHPIAW